MVNLDLSDNEYKLIMRLRKSYNSRKKKFNNFSNDLKKQLERQEQNMRKIASLKFDINPEGSYHENIEKSYLKKIRKTVNENGKIYEILLEDIGDGKGLVEKERKELGKANNINYRFSEMMNNSSMLGKKSYSKMVKTETKKGKKYKVTYEDKGDGKGMIETSREPLNINSLNKSIKRGKKGKKGKKGEISFSNFMNSQNNLEDEFFRNANNMRKKFNKNRMNQKKSRKKSNSSSYSYKKKVIIENINGEGFKVTYENINNEGFKEVNREKI